MFTLKSSKEIHDMTSTFCRQTFFSRYINDEGAKKIRQLISSCPEGVHALTFFWHVESEYHKMEFSEWVINSITTFPL